MKRLSTWNKKGLLLRLEGIKYRNITAESIEALPKYRCKKTVRLKSQTLLDIDSENLTKIFKVLLERYIVNLREVYKYWTAGPTYDTYPGRNGDIIEAKPALNGKYMETLELMKKQSALFYMVLPEFTAVEQYKEAVNLTQEVSEVVCARLRIDNNKFKTAKSKILNNKHKITSEERIYLMQIDNIYKEIKADNLHEMDLIAHCMVYVLKKCIEDKVVSDSMTTLFDAQQFFRDYMYHEILDMNEYNRICSGAPKPKTEEEELRE